MTQEESPLPVEPIQEQVFTPETFAFDLTQSPREALDISLSFPYSSAEWETIFAALIELLSHEDRYIWHQAIRQLIRALEWEASQKSNCEDYQPKPIDQRTEEIFAAIAAQAPNCPAIFEEFCSRAPLIKDSLKTN